MGTQELNTKRVRLMHTFRASLCLALLLVAPMAQASSMPKADLKGQNSLTIGSAPSLATEFSASNKWAFGGSVAIPVLYNANEFIRYNLYTSYTFLEADALTVRGLIGVFGNLNYLQKPDVKPSYFGAQAGIAVAYQINQWIIARANFVPGIGIPFSTGLGLFPPAGGVEVGFRPFVNFEASLGLNGNGDILALRYLF